MIQFKIYLLIAMAPWMVYFQVCTLLSLQLMKNSRKQSPWPIEIRIIWWYVFRIYNNLVAYKFMSINPEKCGVNSPQSPKYQIGEWTRRLMPNIKRWVTRRTGGVSYDFNQFLSSHGCFREYLYKRCLRECCLCLLWKWAGRYLAHLLLMRQVKWKEREWCVGGTISAHVTRYSDRKDAE